jgi:hypothetical protein
MSMYLWTVQICSFFLLSVCAYHLLYEALVVNSLNLIR